MGENFSSSRGTSEEARESRTHEDCSSKTMYFRQAFGPVREAGIEPAISEFKARRFCQLSYSRAVGPPRIELG